MYFDYRMLPYYPNLYTYTRFYENFYLRNGKNNSIYSAIAIIKGGPLAPNIRGMVYFKALPNGTDIYVNVTGLPEYKPAENDNPPVGPFGFHLHEEGCCQIGDPKNPFTCAKGHFNPTNQPHGNHAGDFPVLFSNDGLAKMSFFTDKFEVSQIIGKAVIIHENPDDYRSQPTGNAGRRLACGIVESCW